MSRYPVHYSVSRQARFTRVQLVARLVVFVVLGSIGVTFGAVFAILYFGLPAFAASRLANAQAYVERDAPRVVNLLRWFAALCAWAALVTDRLPSSSPDESVHLSVEGIPSLTAKQVLLRVLTGIPSAVVLALLGIVGAFVWVWAALGVLLAERVGPGAFEYLVGLQRWSIRLLSYQAGLVDEYPPFSPFEVDSSQPEEENKVII